MNDKLEAAIEYLRGRNKYILDPGCKFVPTNAANTDITKAIVIYPQEVSEKPSVRLVKSRKK